MSGIRTPWAEDIEHVTPADGNIFADLGLPDAEERLAKANLAIEIGRTVEAHGWTRVQAAANLDATQPKVSDLLRWRLNAFSIAKLLHYLNLLGRDVEVTVRPSTPAHPRRAAGAH